MQTTISSKIELSGVGLHSGVPVNLRICPARPNNGIVFRRTDVPGWKAEIPAQYDLVQQTPLCTKLVNVHGISVSTVEHVMAALIGCGIHNAIVEVDGAEIPILDGSSAAFVREILSTGIRKLNAPLKALRIERPVEVTRGDAWARLVPHDTLLIEFRIEFEDAGHMLPMEAPRITLDKIKQGIQSFHQGESS